MFRSFRFINFFQQGDYFIEKNYFEERKNRDEQYSSAQHNLKIAKSWEWGWMLELELG